MVLVLLIIRIQILWDLGKEMGTHRTDTITVGLLLTFTLIFSAVLSYFTRGHKYEILGIAVALVRSFMIIVSVLPLKMGLTRCADIVLSSVGTGNSRNGSFKDLGRIGEEIPKINWFSTTWHSFNPIGARNL